MLILQRIFYFLKCQWQVKKGNNLMIMTFARTQCLKNINLLTIYCYFKFYEAWKQKIKRSHISTRFLRTKKVRYCIVDPFCPRCPGNRKKVTHVLTCCRAFRILPRRCRRSWTSSTSTRTCWSACWRWATMRTCRPVFRIRIHMFLGLPDPDLLVRGMDPDPATDPDPSIIMQK